MAFPGWADRKLAAALFLVTSATVMFQVLLTRIFSLTMWYHFAFMAISMAMLGMTLGALAVFLRPRWWPQDTLLPRMGQAALWFAVSMVAVIFMHTQLYVPSPLVSVVPLTLTFAGAAVPFTFSGIFVCLALTRFTDRLGPLYAVDLAGAALGCLLVIAALHWLDGPGAVLACAALAALGATLLTQGRRRAAAAVLAVVLAATAAWSAWHLARHDLPAFPIRYIKGVEGNEVEYERWNSFSRIAVMKPSRWDAPAWSLSAAYKGSLDVQHRWLQIDAGAGTQILAFDGDLAKMEFLRWDLVNFVHHLRRDARVCVVGAGGGRDILTAQVFGQRQVLAIDINDDILNLVTGRLGQYTGNLHRMPGVTLVNDEARSYLARSKERCDILQLTFIDTWAATAAGAYTLTENSLYTVEGWKVFLDRLDDTGLLAVSRGVNPELARTVSLGRAALLASGVAQPERHMVLVTNRLGRWPQSFGAMGVLLVRKTPFPQEELARIRAAAAEMRFDVELEPGRARTRLLAALAGGELREELAGGVTNYDAPTDDQPFFFNMMRPVAWLFSRGTEGDMTHRSVVVLVDLLLIVAALTLAFVAVPFALGKAGAGRIDLLLLVFFGAIGAGFMLIEISMLQRLIIFLGHPSYSLSVILFALLLACGVGAALSARLPDQRLPTHAPRVLAALVGALALAGLALGPAVATLQGAATPVRVAAAIGVLATMGVFMGTAFPLGMRLAATLRPHLTPWLWGINGAMSVLASVLAVVIAMAAGISTSFWTGVASYLLALAAFALAARGARL